jgi:hypothetical protein
MRTFDEEIARRLQEAADSGELRGAKGYGKPTPKILAGTPRRKHCACP